MPLPTNPKWSFIIIIVLNSNLNESPRLNYFVIRLKANRNFTKKSVTDTEIAISETGIRMLVNSFLSKAT